MDNFDLRKYLTEGRLLKEEYTYNEFIRDNFPRINVKKEEIGIKPALKALGVESGDEIEELTNTMDSTNTALYLTNAKENGYLKELPIRSEYFEKAYLGKWKNGESIVVFSDGWDEFVYFRKSLAEGKLLKEAQGIKIRDLDGNWVDGREIEREEYPTIVSNFKKISKSLSEKLKSLYGDKVTYKDITYYGEGAEDEYRVELGDDMYSTIQIGIYQQGQGNEDYMTMIANLYKKAKDGFFKKRKDDSDDKLVDYINTQHIKIYEREIVKPLPVEPIVNSILSQFIELNKKA